MIQGPIHPFAYDSFQKQAIEHIERGTSLLVAAPTGSGKTVLADYVIEKSLSQGQRVIYTSPIKALSNQKFRDFSQRYPNAVGILTGDVTIHATAPLVIMTTEIYRNTLLEDPQRLSSYAWVIFDEVHYLDNPERGTVWEEAILFTPAHIRLLCLSATIPNVEEFAQWIRFVHQQPVAVVQETQRPVPLSFTFQCQNVFLDDLQELKRVGYRFSEDARRWRSYSHGRRHALKPNRLDALVHELREQQQLPCIYFTFGRRRAEDLAWEMSSTPLTNPEERAELLRIYDDLCGRFQVRQDRSAAALRPLIERGVGFHHAGMLPTLKEVIERCFTSRLMKIIVTTETFALGINMPARSVVLDTLKKRSGGGFELLKRREFLQMSGRAGRRGMDEAGFVYLRINPQHVSFPEVQNLLNGNPEPVRSRFNTSYATLLNLYREHGKGLLEFFPKTLYAFQTSGDQLRKGLEGMQQKLDLLKALGYLTSEGLTAKGEFASWIYGYELLIAELYSHYNLATLDAISLAALMTAVVYEPRPGTAAGKSHHLTKRLSELCRKPLSRIHQAELRFHIHPKTKTPFFHLSHAVEAWMARCPFEKLTRYCDADEGEIVRYLRMTIQLLRQLSEIPQGDLTLRGNAKKALERINRDVVDAEAQLRLG